MAKNAVGAICEEDGARLGIHGIHMANTIFFLGFKSVLVLLDHTIQIIINGCQRDNTGLHTTIHGQFIEIVSICFFTNELAIIHHLPEQVMCLLVDLIRIGICSTFEVHFCTIDAKEGIRTALYCCSCFFCVVNIIREGRNPVCIALRRANRPKWSDLCHRNPLSFK